jgi:hypothetical protein
MSEPDPTNAPDRPAAPPKPRSAEGLGSRPLDMGVYGKQDTSQKISTIEVVALVLSLLWLAMVLFFYLTSAPSQGSGSDPLDFVMTILGVFLPVALIWVAASAAKTARTMREESARLQAAIDAMRHAYVEQQQMAGMSIRRSVEDKIESLARAQERADAAIAGMSRPDTPAAPKPAQKPAVTPAAVETQQGLALGSPADVLPEAEPIEMADLIRAVNFPENENDKEGFRTLRRALKDRTAARLINASQDVLTLLSQDGIYMDDLIPDRARPELWRLFAKGERGRPIAALGGIRDRSSLALASGRMRSDPVFKDAAHHFLRQFDRTLTEVETRMSDVELSQLANTRTARAFMLLGRVTGTFD